MSEELIKAEANLSKLAFENLQKWLLDEKYYEFKAQILNLIKNEEWDMVLNTPSQIEVTPPTIDSIIEKRAKRTEHLTEEEQQ